MRIALTATAAVERALSAVRTIRASGATEREVDGVTAAAGAAYTVGVRTAKLQAVVSPAVTIATQGSFIAVLGIGGSRVAAGVLTVGELVSFVLYLFLLVLPLARLAQTWTQLQTGLGALARIEEVAVLPGESAGDLRAAPTMSRPVPGSPRSAPALGRPRSVRKSAPVRGARVGASRRSRSQSRSRGFCRPGSRR